ncbi:hypothetical protein [Streptomyces sp. RPT161]|uniref:hypothetical protein n=1 Tax=Streptomyces sp. RPT161 TaxID=3015993 RepID=UPI0022B90D07|nr:hypothetical protein [Streptomyces sp. RPT161]
MYMNSAPHLLTEDRPDFERVLDEALRAAAEAPAANGTRLSSAQLRTMALSAAAAISACAAAEYDHYLRVREAQRAVVPEPPRADNGHATAGGGAGDTSGGAGLFAIVAVLTPILAGTAALIFLLVGYVLAAMDPEPAIAAPLRTAGWLFLAIAGAGVLAGTVGLVLTALRDGSSAIRATEHDDPAEVMAAKDAWLTALLERGMLPFLHEAQASSGRANAGPGLPGSEDAPIDDRPHMPHGLGYSRPGFSSPGGEEPDSGPPRFSSPRYSSPDFSSPDFGDSDTGRG